MKLSQIDTSTRYPIVIPSSKEETTFRAFLVKEEKALLIAVESEDPAVQLATLEKVIKDCLSPEPKKLLTTFDIEYLFLQIRGKSVDEIASLVGTCGTCKETTDFEVDVTKVEVIYPGDDNTKLTVATNLILQMKYPTIKAMQEIAKETNELTKKFKAIAMCIETVYFDDFVMHTQDTSLEEVLAFLDNRSDAEMEIITKFIENTPTVSLKTSFKCMHCGANNEIELKTLSDFF